MNLSPAEVAADYRRRGLYDLALAAARAGTDALARAEEARALTRLGHPDDAIAAARAGTDALARAEEARAAIPPGCAEPAVRGANATLGQLPSGDAADTPRAPFEADVGLDRPDPAPSDRAHLALLLARGEAELACGRAREARATASVAVDLASTLAPPPSVAVAMALDLLASARLVAGDAPDGLALAARAVAMLEVLGAAPDDRAQALATLAEAHHRAGQWAAAEEAWREALALREAVDPSHPDVAATLDGLGNTLRRRGRLDKAVAAHRRAAPIHLARLGALHPALAAHHHALAQALHRTGDFAGARAELEHALRISERRPGVDHPDTWVTRFELGRLEVDTGDVERGFARMEAARQRLAALLGPDHPTVAAMARWL